MPVRAMFQRTVALTSGVFWYSRDLFRYKRLLKTENNSAPLRYAPQLYDRDPDAHVFDRHYVYMDRWAFRNLLAETPAAHIDIGSSLRFLTMATAVTAVTYVGSRPFHVVLDNFECVPGSVLQMPYTDDSISSLSCLHHAEHIGLGRYGDRLDTLGTKKACAELSRVLAKGGKLYFACPVGRQVTCFNAHRVHSPESIFNYFPDLELVAFAAVDDAGNYHAEDDPENYATASYSCGCFVFTKR
jgi:SAM-dependent methyltransferase